MNENNSFEESHIPTQSEQELTHDKLEELQNPSYLPTHNEISSTFTPDEWHAFCFNKENPVFELLNEEFINTLSAYLAQQAINLNATRDNPVTVLGVGAGNGRLTSFLRQRLEQLRV